MTPERTPSFSLMQAVKRRFFAMRNGDLAAQMAKGGIRYRINFGLTLPQIQEIADSAVSGRLPDYTQTPTEAERLELGMWLWHNDTTRESRLAAPMILRAPDLDKHTAATLLHEVATTEEADVLCHRLLRFHPDAAGIAAAVLKDTEPAVLQRYAALRLVLNLLISNRISPAEALVLISNEKGTENRLLTQLCSRIEEEADFMASC